MDVCKRIVVTVDFNKASVHAFGEALFLAQKNGAEVVLVHVNCDEEKTERYFNNKIREIIEDFGELAHNVDISWRIVPGTKSSIIQQLTRTIDQLEPLFIVVGYDTKSKLNSLLGPNIKDIIYRLSWQYLHSDFISNNFDIFQSPDQFPSCRMVVLNKQDLFVAKWCSSI